MSAYSDHQGIKSVSNTNTSDTESVGFTGMTRMILHGQNYGGEIIYTRRMPTFTFPLGLNIIINNGAIRYVEDF